MLLVEVHSILLTVICHISSYGPHLTLTMLLIKQSYVVNVELVRTSFAGEIIMVCASEWGMSLQRKQR